MKLHLDPLLLVLSLAFVADWVAYVLALVLDHDRLGLDGSFGEQTPSLYR